MYNKSDIVKNLNEFNYFIDEATLSNFIKNWKIDAIYEDEDNVEFFDNLAISKLKKGISLKSQGFTNEQITYHVNKLLPEKLANQEKEKAKEEAKKEITPVRIAGGGDMNNLTIDVTNQTLQMLAEAVAEKITTGIKNSDFLLQLLDETSLKKDNQALAKEVQELMDDNKKLAKRVEELEYARKNSLINFEYFRKFFR